MSSVSFGTLPFSRHSVSDFARDEIQRVGASLAEVRSAFAFVASPAARDPRIYESLSPRMRRLVDLVAVAADGVHPDVSVTGKTLGCETFAGEAFATDQGAAIGIAAGMADSNVGGWTARASG